jgi:hypothetical protein
MDRYRIFFFRGEHIRAGGPMSAESDAEAAETAALLYDACSDVIESCEVWRGADCVAKLNRHSAGLSVSLVDLVEARKGYVIELAETLQSSFSFIRESRRLPKRLERISASRPGG